jgi:hypothetical protein
MRGHPFSRAALRVTRVLRSADCEASRLGALGARLVAEENQLDEQEGGADEERGIGNVK